MAKKSDVVTMLYSRFASVPGFTEDNAEAMVNEAMVIFNIPNDPNTELSSQDVLKVLAYSSAESAMSIALNTAFYFKFTDGEETVDKSMTSENYRKLAAEYRLQLASIEKNDMQHKATSKFTNTHRIDRPPFQRR